MKTQSYYLHTLYKRLSRISATLLSSALFSSLLLVAGGGIAQAQSSHKHKRPSSQDNWLGGTDNWSNGAQWSAGAPGNGSDVVIYSGGDDFVYLDVNATINSLTLGGTTGTSYLSGYGNFTQVLDIVNGITVNATGSLQLLQLQTVNAATISNMGSVYVGQNATLNLFAQPNGITDIVQNSAFFIAGTFNAGNQSALANLSSVEGKLRVASAQNIQATPAGGIFTIGATGLVTADNAALHINGDLSNFGVLTVDSGGGSQIVVTGLLTNQTDAFLTNMADHVSFGSLSNQGLIINWGTITLTNQPNGITEVVAGSEIRNYGSILAGANDGFGQLQSIDGRLLIENGRINSVAPGNGTLSITSPGYLELDRIFRPETILKVNGNLVNAGQIKSNGGSLTVAGDLINNNRLEMFGNGLPDQSRLLAIGSLVNTGRITADYGATVTTPFLVNAGQISVDKQSAFMVGSGTAGLGYLQYADGILGESISTANIFGTIWLEGGATLDGTLSVMLANGYLPQIGQIIRFMYFKPGSLSGEFAKIDNQYFNNGTEEWIVNYDNADGYLELQAIAAQPTPEPASLIMLGTGLVSAVTFLRRRCKA